MKKSLFTIYLSLIAISLCSQIDVQGKHLIIDKDSVKVIMFDSITNDTQISYQGANIRFFTFEKKNTNIYSTSLLPPDDATGYLVQEDGVWIDTLWVIDYSNYTPVFRSFEAENNPTDQCERMNLILDATFPLLNYKTIAGSTYSLPRECEIAYKTLEWKGTSWQTLDTVASFTAPSVSINIPTPLQNTTFELTGEQYANQLSIEPHSINSSLYITPAILPIKSITTIRTAENEDKRPTQNSFLDGSAPLDIQFVGGANESNVMFYKWEILKDDILLATRTDKEHRYTFDKAGNYKVKLTTSNNYCSKSDSITVTVSESQIQVPNVFTPNNDGFNDEFRVAYKSIVKFDAWVYNRSGRLVFRWSDPSKGWDGKINGKDAVPGPYFYVIQAYGSDFDKNSKPSKISKKRIGEYLLKGDINLLRGVK